MSLAGVRGRQDLAEVRKTEFQARLRTQSRCALKPFQSSPQVLQDHRVASRAAWRRLKRPSLSISAVGRSPQQTTAEREYA
jgi:hypothetical protein